MRVWCLDMYLNREDDAAAIRALAADLLASHTALQELSLGSNDDEVLIPPITWLDSIVDAAVTRRLRSVMFMDCAFTPASAPALARLVGGGALTKLSIYRTRNTFLDEPGAALLCAALRSSTGFIKLSFRDTHFWRSAGVEVVRALVAHPSLHKLSLASETPATEASKAAAGAALGALVATNSPAFHELSLFQCQLSDAGLAPVFAALRLNTHLRSLNCGFSAVSEAFVRDAVLPAVRANVGLQALRLHPVHQGADWPDARRAEFIVRIRQHQA